MLFLNQMEINKNFKFVDHNYRKNGNIKNDFINDENSDDIYENHDSESEELKINDMNINCLITKKPNQTELKSILNYCEEHIKENDDYKRAMLRRASSVKVPSIKASINNNNNSSSSNSNDDVKKPEKKVVRFADALGLDLVKVKMILNPDRPPRIPKHILKVFRDANKYSDDDDDDDDYDDFYYQQQLQHYHDLNNNNNKNSYLNTILFNKFSTKPGTVTNTSTKKTSSTTTTTATTTNGYSLRRYNDDSFQLNNCKYSLKWRQLFEQPGIRPDFFAKLNDNKVSLETVHIKSHQISGVIRVSNLCFNKIVKLRYTTDKWMTSTDVDAAYINNSCDGFTDRFSFNVNFENNLVEYFNNLKDLNNTYRIEFAVFYEARSCDYHCYWDNNYGINFVIECINITSPTQSTNDLICDLSNNLSAAFV
jgi:hypothetical protein